MLEDNFCWIAFHSDLFMWILYVKYVRTLQLDDYYMFDLRLICLLHVHLDSLQISQVMNQLLAAVTWS